MDKIPIYIEDPWLPTEKYEGKHTFINEDIFSKERPPIDEVLKICSQVLVSFEFAEGQLYNIDSKTNECFNPDKVEIAYKKGINFELAISEVYIKTTMGIDPGGRRDAFGVTIYSLTNFGRIVLRWCKRFYNSTHEAKKQAKEIAAQYIRYNVEECQSESSAGSPWSLSLISHYVLKMSNGDIRFRFTYVNFAAEKTILAKDNFVYLFKILLDYEVLILFKRNDEERALLHQITKYIPNKSQSNNNPDDLVESAFHCVWLLLDGLKYINKLTDKETVIVGETL